MKEISNIDPDQLALYTSAYTKACDEYRWACQSVKARQNELRNTEAYRDSRIKNRDKAYAELINYAKGTITDVG